MLQEAIALHQKGRLAEAETLYRKILLQNPQSADALHLLGVIEFQKNNLSGGIELIDRAIGIEPNNPSFFFNRGKALADLKRFDAALSSYDRALAIKPDDARAFYRRGEALRHLNRYEEALASYDNALKITPAYVEALNSRGLLLVQLKRFDAALVSFNRSLSINPDDVEVLSLHGVTLVELKRPNEAVASFDRALAIRPDYVEALNNRGNALQALTRFDDALASYDKALAFKSDYADALVNRGIALHALKRLDDALGSYDRALAIKPDHPEGLSKRGIVLRELNRLEDALESFDKALAIRSDLENAAFNRELVLLDLGRLTRIPPLALRVLFDRFSSHFDQTMLERLGYRAHIHLRTLAERVLPRLSRPWHILDLGVGTGLVGEVFKDLAAGGRLDGIDVSARMIDAARARNIYDNLILGDLETVLAEPGLCYDLILAADTMIYIGDLAPTFSGIVRRLVSGGFYVFSSESKPGEGWDRAAQGRFRHSAAYLYAEAWHAGLEFIDIMECVLRTESHNPVPGFAVALRKP